MQYKKNLLALLAATALTTSLTQAIFAVPDGDVYGDQINSASDNKKDLVNNQASLQTNSTILAGYESAVTDAQNTYDTQTSAVTTAQNTYNSKTTAVATAQGLYNSTTAGTQERTTAQTNLNAALAQQTTALATLNAALDQQTTALATLNTALDNRAQAQANVANDRNKIAAGQDVVAVDEGLAAKGYIESAQDGVQIDLSQPDANVKKLNEAAAQAQVGGDYAQRVKDRSLVASRAKKVADLENQLAGLEKNFADVGDALKLKLDAHKEAVNAMTGKTGADLESAKSKVEGTSAALTIATNNFNNAKNQLTSVKTQLASAQNDLAQAESALESKKLELEGSLDSLEQIKAGKEPVVETTVASIRAAKEKAKEDVQGAKSKEKDSIDGVKEKTTAVENAQKDVESAKQKVTEELNILTNAKKLKTDAQVRLIKAQDAFNAIKASNIATTDKVYIDASTEHGAAINAFNQVQNPSSDNLTQAKANLKDKQDTLVAAQALLADKQNTLAIDSTSQVEFEMLRIKNMNQLVAEYKKSGNVKEAKVEAILAQNDLKHAKNEAQQAEYQVQMASHVKLFNLAQVGFHSAQDDLDKAQDDSYKAQDELYAAKIELNELNKDTVNSSTYQNKLDAVVSKNKALEEAKKKENSVQLAFTSAKTKLDNAKAALESSRAAVEFATTIVDNQDIIERQELENKVDDTDKKLADHDKKLADHDKKDADLEKKDADHNKKLADLEKKDADHDKEVAELKKRIKELEDSNPQIAEKKAVQSQIDNLKQLAPVAFPQVKEMTAKHSTLTSVVESAKSLITEGTILPDDPRRLLMKKLIEVASNPAALKELDLSAIEQALNVDSKQIQARVDVVNDAIRSNTSVVSNRLVDQIANANIASGENDQVGGGAWMQVIGNTGELKGTKTLQNFTSKALGMVAGADYKVKNLTVGIFGGVNLSFVTNSNNTADKDNMTSYIGGMYLNLEVAKNLAVSAIAGASQTQLSGEKESNIMGEKVGVKTKLDPNANSYFADVRVKYSLKFKDSLSLVPTLGYKVYKNDAFKYKTVGVMETSFDAATNHFIVLGANMIVSSLGNSAYKVTPELHVFGEISMSDNKNNVSSNFFTGAQIPMVNELRDSSNLLNVGGSLTVVNGKKEFSAGLDWNSKSDYNGFVGRLNVRINL